MNLVSHSVNETLKIGRILSRDLRTGDILCLFGQLGSGKTVLVKGIAEGLGMNRSRIVSSSFVLIREYKTRIPLYHFDLYRLGSPKDVLALGYEEYIYGNGITVIEWADRLQGLLPEEFLKIKLEIKQEKTRKINFVPLGKRYQIFVKLLSLAYPRPHTHKNTGHKLQNRYENIRH